MRRRISALFAAALLAMGIVSATQAAAAPAVTVTSITCNTPGQLKVTYTYSGFANASLSVAEQIYVGGVTKYNEVTPLFGSYNQRTVTVLGIYYQAQVQAKAQATQNGVQTNGNKSLSVYCGKP